MAKNGEQGTRDTEHGTGNETLRRPRKGDDLSERLLAAVGGVQRLLCALQRDAASRHVAQQLWRAATGGGANYEEARGAESRADFVHKVRVATKELREALYWLRVTRRSNWVKPEAIDDLVGELDQLVAILVASARTAKSRTP
jgi:four helix bundle protein